jgi:hypothetical protein
MLLYRADGGQAQNKHSLELADAVHSILSL